TTRPRATRERAPPRCRTGRRRGAGRGVSPESAPPPETKPSEVLGQGRGRVAERLLARDAVDRDELLRVRARLRADRLRAPERRAPADERVVIPLLRRDEQLLLLVDAELQRLLEQELRLPERGRQRERARLREVALLVLQRAANDVERLVGRKLVGRDE